jgi:anaerobic selenocysteine-containing dehydrogenase
MGPMSSRTAFRTCPLCEACCGLEIEIEDERVKRIRGDRAHVLSKGYICPKGSTLKQLHEDPDRLRRPLIRDGNSRRQVTWEEAFAEIDRRLSAIWEENGRNAVALYIGNPNVHQLDNQLAIRPLAKALGSRNIFSASTVDQMPKQISCGYMFGHPFTIPVPDLDRTDYLLMLGANPYESNGSLCTAPDFGGRLEAIRNRGGKVVVVDPRRTKTALNADLWLPIRPGTDAALLCAVAGDLFRTDRVALGHLQGLVNGLDEVGEALVGFTPQAVEAYTGVPAETIRMLAADLASASAAAVYGRIGTHTTSFGTLAAWGVDLLNVLTGNLDRPGGAMFPLAFHQTRQRRVRKFKTGRWQSRVRMLAEMMGELPVATMADEILTPGEGQVRALITVAGNPVLTTPDAGRLDEALNQLEFMVSVDPYLNETTRHAYVVLPPPSALERSHLDISFTTLAVREYADFSPAVFDTDQPSEFEILVRLTAILAGMGTEVDPRLLAETGLMGRIDEATKDPFSSIGGRDPVEIAGMLGNRPASEKIVDLMIRTGHRGDGFGAVPDGLTLAALAEQPHGIDFGPLQSRLPDLLSTESGKIELAPPPLIEDLKRLTKAVGGSQQIGLVLVGRRQLRSVNSWLHNVEVAVRGRELCTLEMNPADAARLGISDGGMAEVASRVGKVRIPVEVTENIVTGVVCIPYGWGHDLPGSSLSVAGKRPGVNTNLLTDSEPIDPLSGNAVLNGIPVMVTPVSV